MSDDEINMTVKDVRNMWQSISMASPQEVTIPQTAKKAKPVVKPKPVRLQGQQVGQSHLDSTTPITHIEPISDTNNTPNWSPPKLNATKSSSSPSHSYTPPLPDYESKPRPIVDWSSSNAEYKPRNGISLHDDVNPLPPPLPARTSTSDNSNIPSIFRSRTPSSESSNLTQSLNLSKSPKPPPPRKIKSPSVDSASAKSYFELHPSLLSGETSVEQTQQAGSQQMQAPHVQTSQTYPGILHAPQIVPTSSQVPHFETTNPQQNLQPPQTYQVQTTHLSPQQLSPAPPIPPRQYSPFPTQSNPYGQYQVPVVSPMTNGNGASSYSSSNTSLNNGFAQSATSLNSEASCEDDEIKPDPYQYPDFAYAARRCPAFPSSIDFLKAKSEVRAIAISGTNIYVSTGAKTKLVNVRSGEEIASYPHDDLKVTASCIVSLGNGTESLWLGCKDGSLMQLDSHTLTLKSRRTNVHVSSVAMISVCHQSREIWTMSDDGKVGVWSADSLTASDGTLRETFRTLPQFNTFLTHGDQLWVARDKGIQIYQPSSETLQLTPRPISLPLYAGAQRQVGDFTCAASNEGLNLDDSLYFGHSDGSISVFSKSRQTCTNIYSFGIHSICSLRVLFRRQLWIGMKTGEIIVCDLTQTPWKVMSRFKAHDHTVSSIICDDVSFCHRLDNDAVMLPVCSFSVGHGTLKIWDGLLKCDWIESEMYSASETFSTFREITVQVVTWNAGAAKPERLDADPTGAAFLRNLTSYPSHSQPPEVIVFGFQELVDLENKSASAKSIFQKRKKGGTKDISVNSKISHQYKNWQDRLCAALEETHPGKYRMVQSSNLMGLFTCVFHGGDPKKLQGVDSWAVKNGLGGMHGNKGALVVRLFIDDSSFCFVNCHLAAGQSSSMNRNKDIESILNTPAELDESEKGAKVFKNRNLFINGGDGTMILDHETCILSGDLNYRINLHRQVAMHLIRSNSIEKLLEADQLSIQLKKNPAFRLRSFKEPPITFPPTYKFDVGSDEYDTSEKKRVPAWCDRIFIRSRWAEALSYSSPTVRVSDHRPVAGLFKVNVKTVEASKRQAAYKDCLRKWDEHVKSLR